MCAAEKMSKVEEEEPLFYLGNTKSAGIGVFASRDIREGEIIVKERPFFLYNQTLVQEATPVVLPSPHKYTTLEGEEAYFVADNRMLHALQAYAMAPASIRVKILGLYRPSSGDKILQKAPMCIMARQVASACWELPWYVATTSSLHS